MSKQPRHDGLGIILLAVVMLAVIGLAFSSGLRPLPEPDDTGTQISMSLANWLMAWVSVAAAAIGAISLLLLRLTWLEAQRSADAAEQALNQAQRTTMETIRIGEAQTRAYVVVTSASIEETFRPDRWKLRFQFRNSGQTPARELFTTITVTFQTDTADEETRWASERRPRSDLASQEDKNAVIQLPTEKLRAAQGMNDDAWIEAEIVVEYVDVFGSSQNVTAKYELHLSPYNKPGAERPLSMFRYGVPRDDDDIPF